VKAYERSLSNSFPQVSRVGLTLQTQGTAHSDENGLIRRHRGPRTPNMCREKIL
jgi:hypothetical protein